jgi:hypothetical protein
MDEDLEVLVRVPAGAIEPELEATAAGHPPSVWQ